MPGLAQVPTTQSAAQLWQLSPGSRTPLPHTALEPEVGVAVGVKVALGVTVAVGVKVALGVTVAVGVKVALGVADGCSGVAVGVSLPMVSVAVAAVVAVAVGLASTVAVGLASTVAVGLASTVAVGSAVAVGVGSAVAVLLGAAVSVAVGAAVLVTVATAVSVAVDTGVGVPVWSGVAVLVGGAMVTVGVAGQPPRALFTAWISSAMVTVPPPSGSKAGQTEIGLAPREMLTPRIRLLIETAPLPLQSPTHCAEAAAGARRTAPSAARCVQVRN